MSEREVRHIEARVHGRYLVRTGPAVPRGLLVGFHGFGETADTHLAELERLPELEGWVLAAVEALHPFYRRNGEIVSCWMTRRDRELAIADNVAYTRGVLERLIASVGEIPLVLVGFSQGTAMAYRTAVGCGLPISGVIALGGDVPPELSELEALPFSRVLIGRGRQEEWYDAERLARDVALLDAQGVSPEVFEFDGGHEWTDAFRERAAGFLLDIERQERPGDAPTD